MNEMIKSDQIERVLQMYAKLSDGYVVNKAEAISLTRQFWKPLRKR